LSQRVYSS
jgi:hypothetical protein